MPRDSWADLRKVPNDWVRDLIVRDCVGSRMAVDCLDTLAKISRG
jgi:hypothetical protein